MKISRGRPTFMKSLKKYPLVSMLLSGSGFLFQCTLQVKYTKVLSSHTWLLQRFTQEISEKLQNRAIRVITKSSYDISSRFLLNALGWDNLSVTRAKQKANLMYKCINNLAPPYFCNLFAPRTPSFYFRNAKKRINAPKTKNWLPETKLSYTGALLSNNLPEEIRTVFENF